MRTQKFIIIFIFVAFISFSCGNDGVYNEETNREMIKKRKAKRDSIRKAERDSIARLKNMQQ